MIFVTGIELACPLPIRSRLKSNKSGKGTGSFFVPPSRFFQYSRKESLSIKFHFRRLKGRIGRGLIHLPGSIKERVEKEENNRSELTDPFPGFGPFFLSQGRSGLYPALLLAGGVSLERT